MLLQDEEAICPPDVIEHPCHGQNPSKLFLCKSNNILRRWATPPEFMGDRIVNSWMEWLASGSRREGMREVDRGDLNKNKMARKKFGHQFLTIDFIDYSGCLHLRP